MTITGDENNAGVASSEHGGKVAGETWVQLGLVLESGAHESMHLQGWLIVFAARPLLERGKNTKHRLDLVPAPECSNS